MASKELDDVWGQRINESIGDEDFSDACFKVKNCFGVFSEIKCNRVLLSLASPVFKKQFFGSLRVNDGAPINIIDGTAEAFKDVIDFIYCEKSFHNPLNKYAKVDTTNTFKHLLGFCYFGHKYEIPSLVNFASYVINNNLLININNVIGFLVEIESCKLNLESEYHVIRNKCFCFIDKNFEALFFPKGYSEPPEVNDGNFLSFFTMYTLLKRPSLRTSEFSIYQLLKEYFICLTEEDKNIFSADGSSCVLDIFTELVDFTKMTLIEIKKIGQEKWLPQDFLLDLSISAMELNSTGLKPSTTRNKKSLTELSIQTQYNVSATNETLTIFKLSQRAIFVVKIGDCEEITFTQGVRTELVTKRSGKQHCFYVEPEISITLKVKVKPAYTKLNMSRPVQKKSEKNGIEIEFLSETIQTDIVWSFYPVDTELSEQSLKKYQRFFQLFSKKDGAIGQQDCGKQGLIKLSEMDWKWKTAKDFGAQGQTAKAFGAQGQTAKAFGAQGKSAKNSFEGFRFNETKLPPNFDFGAPKMSTKKS